MGLYNVQYQDLDNVGKVGKTNSTLFINKQTKSERSAACLMQITVKKHCLASLPNDRGQMNVLLKSIGRWFMKIFDQFITGSIIAEEMRKFLEFK